jgi:hypothetical protein
MCSALLGIVSSLINAINLNETGVLDPRPKLLGFHMPYLAACPQMPNQDAGKGRERGFISQLRTCHGKRQNEHSAIFSHLWGIDMSCRFKWTKELGSEDKRYMHS